MKKYKFILIAIVIGLVLAAGLIVYFKLKNKSGLYDSRTEANLNTLDPDVRKKVEKVLKEGIKNGYDLRLISGRRSCNEQNKFYAQGRTTSGDIVTNAKCGQSYHNFGLAGDFAFFRNGSYWQNAPWDKLGAWCANAKLEWGGTWSSIKDYPHCQDSKGHTTAQLYQHYKSTGNLNIV